MQWDVLAWRALRGTNRLLLADVEVPSPPSNTSAIPHIMSIP